MQPTDDDAPPPDGPMFLSEALDLLAERTSWRTEEESRLVRAALAQLGERLDAVERLTTKLAVRAAEQDTPPLVLDGGDDPDEPVGG